MMYNNKRLTPEEIAESLIPYKGLVQDEICKAIKQYAAQELVSIATERDDQKMLADIYYNNYMEAQRKLQKVYDERDNALIMVKSLQQERNEKDALLKEAIRLLDELYNGDVIGPIGGLKSVYSVKVNDFLSKTTGGETNEGAIIPIASDDYKHCNHYHELTPDHQLVNFGDGEFVANNAAVPLLKALNEAGLRTRTHHMQATGEAFVSILLDNAQVEIRQVNETAATRNQYNGKFELLISWIR